MTKAFRISILLSLLWLPMEMRGQESFRTILVFFGADETRPAYSRILEGLKNSFQGDSVFNVNFIHEYLDLERTSDSLHIRKIVELYNTKVRTASIDLVITVAPGAYDVLKYYKLEMLSKVPVINIELTPKPDKSYIPDSRVTEIQIEWSPGISMAHAFELFPGRHHAYVVGGCSGSDRVFMDWMARDAKSFQQTHQFTFISCSRIDSVLTIVKKLPDTGLLFLATFITDADGTPLSTATALRLLSRHSSVPVLTMSDNFIDHGGFGGKVISFTDVGNEAGKVAKEMFVTDATNGFRKISKAFYRYQYNWKEIKKWKGVNHQAIPDERIFFFREISFLEKYKWQLSGILLLICFLILIVFYLFRLLREQKKLAEQKNHHEQLYRQLLRDERMSEMSLFTGSLAHEVNQPLAAILFNTQAGLRFYQSGRLTDVQSKAILSDIETDVKRASGIISNLRSLMKMEERVMKAFDLTMIIREVLEILQAELLHKDVVVELDAPEEPLVVTVVKIEIQQVLINLITNALRAMQANPQGRKRIYITVKRNSDLAWVTVADNGPGLPEQLKDRIFDVFVTTHKAGMGIGLALCKSIVERHKGEIRAENRPEGGASFSFSLPQNHQKS